MQRLFIRTISFILFWCIGAVTGYGQCCYFDIDPISINTNLRRIESSNALEYDCNDLSYCYSKALITKFHDGNIDGMHEDFEKLINSIEGELNVEHLKMIFNYAFLLEMIGQYDIAIFYYEFVLSNSKSGTYVNLLAKISEVGKDGRISASTKFVNTFESKLENLSKEEQLILIRHLSNYLDIKEVYTFLGRFYHLKNDAVNYEGGHIFLRKMERVFLYFSDDRVGYISNLIDKIEDVHGPLNDNVGYLSRKALESKDKGDYEGQLEYARRAVEIEFGEFNSVEELIKIYADFPHKYRTSFEYFAKANLFQTRLGKGNSTVVDAFNLYEVSYSSSLQKTYASLFNLTGERTDKEGTSFENQLIVGTYLFEKTGDIDYLNRSIRIMDGFSGAAALFWAKVRAEMRKDDSFREGLEDLHAKERQLRADIPTIRLSELFAREQAIRKQEAAFKGRYRSIFSGDVAEADIDLDAISAEMKTDSAAAISFYNNGRTLYRLYVAGDSIQVSILNQYIPEVEQLTEDLAQLLANPKATATADTMSYRLYDILFGDLENILPQRLHIVATGVMADIPFSGLRTNPPGEQREYLGTRHAISRQFSMGSMRALRDVELSPEQARPLAMAPSFGNDFVAASELRQAGFALPPLLYSREEVEHLEGLSDGEFLYDDRATLDRYRKSAPGYGIIHLASHAISSQREGILSRVFLLDEAGEPTPLYAGDIGSETLNAELVVLSACETGGGFRHAVEGRVGLTKAYLAAGARSVVSSSWAVDDRATSELMNEFYTATAAGQAPNDALQTARKAYLSRHPNAPVANWAAFEAYGGMKPVRWEQKNGELPWGWIGGGLLAVVLGGTVLRRKMAA